VPLYLSDAVVEPISLAPRTPGSAADPPVKSSSTQEKLERGLSLVITRLVMEKAGDALEAQRRRDVAGRVDNLSLRLIWSHREYGDTSRLSALRYSDRYRRNTYRQPFSPICSGSASSSRKNPEAVGKEETTLTTSEGQVFLPAYSRRLRPSTFEPAERIRCDGCDARKSAWRNGLRRCERNESPLAATVYGDVLQAVRPGGGPAGRALFAI
jgi:hypothetical protein